MDSGRWLTRGRGVAVFAFVVVVGLAPGAARGQVPPSPAPTPVASPTTSLRFGGVATNVTANASTGVQFTVQTRDNVTFTSAGAFDSVNLYGRWTTMSGRAIPCQSTNGAQCVQFTGQLELGGGDGSGFRTGTRASFVLSLVISGTSAAGVYHIGRTSGRNYDQYGTLALFVQR
jgi:hypothetical protein